MKRGEKMHCTPSHQVCLSPEQRAAGPSLLNWDLQGLAAIGASEVPRNLQFFSRVRSNSQLGIALIGLFASASVGCRTSAAVQGTAVEEPCSLTDFEPWQRLVEEPSRAEDEAELSNPQMARGHTDQTRTQDRRAERRRTSGWRPEEPPLARLVTTGAGAHGEQQQRRRTGTLQRLYLQQEAIYHSVPTNANAVGVPQVAVDAHLQPLP